MLFLTFSLCYSLANALVESAYGTYGKNPFGDGNLNQGEVFPYSD